MKSAIHPRLYIAYLERQLLRHHVYVCVLIAALTGRGFYSIRLLRNEWKVRVQTLSIYRHM